MSEVKMVSVERDRMEQLAHLQEEAERRKATWDEAVSDAKDAKGEYDEAKKKVDAALKSLIRNLRGESDLPLFSQADAVEKAKADPVAAKLTERLIDAGFRVNLLVVFGYDEARRNQVAAYLDALESEDVDVVPERPEFLDPPRDEDALAAGLAEMCVVDIPAEKLATLSDEDFDAAMAHLQAVSAIHMERGGEIVLSDVPALPAFLTALMPSDEAAVVGASEPTAVDAAVVPADDELLPVTDEAEHPDAF